MNDLVKSVRATGGIGVVGVFIPEDPGSRDKLAKKGEIVFDFGLFWVKGQHIATGQANVKAYNHYLRDLIHADRAKPSWIVSHELALDEAPEAYKHFDARDNGWTKVILHPAGMQKNPKRKALKRRPFARKRCTLTHPRNVNEGAARQKAISYQFNIMSEKQFTPDQAKTIGEQLGIPVG